MSTAPDVRKARRLLSQLSRRARSGVDTARLSRDVLNAAEELRRTSEVDAQGAGELLVALLGQIPTLFSDLEDRRGIVAETVDVVAAVTADVFIEAVDLDVERADLFDRLFGLWITDETGILDGLDECLLASLVDESDEILLGEICRLYLRDVPLVFPAVRGSKLDIERTILLRDRYRVERLLGEILNRQGHSAYSVIITLGYFRLTGDAVDHLRALDRAGCRAEAEELARKLLRDPKIVRRAAVAKILEDLSGREDSACDALEALVATFVDDPSRDHLDAIQAVVPAGDWDAHRADALSRAESRGEDLDLVFRRYLEEGMITEADGLVASRPVNPYVVATGADSILEQHTDRAAGWLLVASHHLVKRSRSQAYPQVADWLVVAREAADETGQAEGFARAINDFKSRWSRRTALLRVLDEHGL